MIVIHRTLKIILAIAIGSMSLTNVQTASASEIASIEQSAASHNGSLSESVKEVPGDLLQSRDNGLILNPVPNQTSPSSTMVSAMSVFDTLKWVCKSALTLVGVGAWVTSVYYSGGTLLTVSNWVIRYVTVPSLLCNWL